jgi:hypothetical protein
VNAEFPPFMQMKKIFVTCIFILTLCLSAFSQSHYKHNNFWGRVVLTDKITDKLKWEIFYQYRSQNDGKGSLNIFRYHQLTSYWVWLNYQLFKDLKVSLTPFCYFNTISLFPQPASIGNRGVKEYRWALRAEHTQKLKYFNYINRYSIEYRWRDLIEAGIFIPNYRARYMTRFEKPLYMDFLKGKPFSLILYDEIFFEFGRAVQSNVNIFNQNRIYAGFSYEFIKNIKLNLGYMYVTQVRQSGKDFDNSNTLWVILTFDNVFSQFIKRKPIIEEIKN